MQEYCGACKKNMNYKVLCEKEEVWNDSDMWGKTKYQIVQCKGCDNIFFREEMLCSEDINVYTGEPEPIITIYPDAKEKLSLGEVECFLPDKLSKICLETIGAYNSKIYTLCAVGLRAVVEGICEEQGVTRGKVRRSQTDGTTEEVTSKNLDGKINGLVEKGCLTEYQARVLHNHRFLGNEAVHRLEVPSGNELKIAIEVIIDILGSIYALGYKESQLVRMRENRVGRS